MATAVAAATRPAASKDVHVPVSRALVDRMGGLERLREYLMRMDSETEYLEIAGGGQWRSEVDVNGKARGGRTGEIYTAPRRKL